MPKLSSYTQKVTPAGGDLIPISDSAASNDTKNLTVDNLATKVNASAAHTGASTFNDDLIVDTDKFVVDQSTGNVGVGTASGTGRLTVNEQNTSGVNQEVLRLSTQSGGVCKLEASDLSLAAPTWRVNTGPSEDFAVAINGSEAMRIDSAGLVGIGTSAPEELLHVHDSSGADSSIRVTNNTTGVGASNGFELLMGTSQVEIVNRENGHMAFKTNNVEAARLDSSQNLLVGKTSPNVATVGIENHNNGHLSVTRDGNTVGQFNRLTDDGDIVLFKQDSVEVGSIATSGTKFIVESASGALALNANGAERVQIESTGITRPGTDNTQSLGKASFRWSEVFAGNGTINTSDEREKTEEEITTAILDAVDSISIKGFKWNDAIDLKGDGARIHFGVFAQEVKAAFEAQGLVAEDYSLLCFNEWEDEFKTVTVEPAVYETNIITPAVEGVEAVAEELNEDGEVIVKAVEAVEAVEEVTEQVLVTPAVTEEQLVTPAGNRYGVRYDELMALKVACLERKIEALG